MKLKHTATLLVGLEMMPLHAQFRARQHYALTAAQVTRYLAKAFAERGIQLSDAQVTLPANVVSVDPEPVLDVASIRPLGHLASDRSGEVSSAVKLTCRAAGTCLPFYAIVTLPKGLEYVAPAKSGITPPMEPPTRRAAVEFTILTGKRATLVLKDGSTSIQMEVITLESGVAGHTVHVASLDHKQKYVAEVVSESLLKGSF